MRQSGMGDEIHFNEWIKVGGKWKMNQKLIGFGEFPRNTATHRDDLKTVKLPYKYLGQYDYIIIGPIKSEAHYIIAFSYRTGFVN